MKDFPQELIDRVLDDLYDDNHSLVQCSLVCRAFLPATRYHLFAELHLERAPTKSSTLLELALGPCTFAPFTTLVSITDGSLDAPEVVDQASLQLHLSFSSLTDLTLTDVKFDSLRQLLATLEICPGLTSLDIYNVECPPSPESSSYSHPVGIQKFRLGRCPDALKFFASDVVAFNCANVSFINMGLDDVKSIGGILRRVGENLRDICLDFDEQAFCHHADLRCNTQLRNLSVWDMIRCHDGSTVFCLNKLPDILRTITSPYISEIDFTLYIDKAEHLEDFAWAALDDSLVAPNLSSVTKITFCIRGEMREDHLTAEAAIRLEMPQCCAKRNMIFLDCW
ncbi:hypothetical protein FB451DRAFT_1387708 [Mycena latifolia]|nr:hypothetical protein FB451DRAFT_1387708 [Mycena latifolia]